MTVQRDSRGRFKSKGIERHVWVVENSSQHVLAEMINEVIDELNALKAWKEEQEEKESEENAKKVAQSWKEEEEYQKVLRKDKKEGLGEKIHIQFFENNKVTVTAKSYQDLYDWAVSATSHMDDELYEVDF